MQHHHQRLGVAITGVRHANVVYVVSAADSGDMVSVARSLYTVIPRACGHKLLGPWPLQEARIAGCNSIAGFKGTAGTRITAALTRSGSCLHVQVNRNISS
jgi:hypothetical protein